MGAKLDYAAVFDALPVPCTVVTPDLVIVAANDACLKVTHRPREEIVGQTVQDAFADQPDFVDALRISVRRVASTGEMHVIPLVRHDVEGEERYWSMAHVPVPGPDGRLSWVISWADDVTPLAKEALLDGAESRPVNEARLCRHARDLLELSCRLKQAYRQEQQTVSALHEAIEHQQRFLFDATHDLRNPITGLLTELELALTEAPPDVRPTLRKLHQNTERLNDIVADLLVLARLYTATPPVTDVVDLAELVREEMEAHPPGHRVITRLEPGVVVRASRVRLARVLANLVANAERHATSRIEITVRPDPPYARMEVVDDGPGIPPENREKIFHRMYRLGEARAKDPGGSGFGLPIGREIAHAYGGDLYAADHPDGARLVLRLPLAG